MLTEEFEVESSDVDLLVTFESDRDNLFHDYFDLKADLERILSRRVDLVIERSIVNPFFKANALANAQKIYAAESRVDSIHAGAIAR